MEIGRGTGQRGRIITIGEAEDRRADDQRVQPGVRVEDAVDAARGEDHRVVAVAGREGALPHRVDAGSLHHRARAAVEGQRPGDGRARLAVLEAAEIIIGQRGRIGGVIERCAARVDRVVLKRQGHQGPVHGQGTVDVGDGVIPRARAGHAAHAGDGQGARDDGVSAGVGAGGRAAAAHGEGPELVPQEDAVDGLEADDAGRRDFVVGRDVGELGDRVGVAIGLAVGIGGDRQRTLRDEQAQRRVRPRLGRARGRGELESVRAADRIGVTDRRAGLFAREGAERGTRADGEAAQDGGPVELDGVARARGHDDAVRGDLPAGVAGVLLEARVDEVEQRARGRGRAVRSRRIFGAVDFRIGDGGRQEEVIGGTAAELDERALGGARGRRGEERLRQVDRSLGQYGDADVAGAVGLLERDRVEGERRHLRAQDVQVGRRARQAREEVDVAVRRGDRVRRGATRDLTAETVADRARGAGGEDDPARAVVDDPMRRQVAAVAGREEDAAAGVLRDGRAETGEDPGVRADRRQGEAARVRAVGDERSRQVIVADAAGGEDRGIAADGVVGEVTLQVDGGGDRVERGAAQQHPDLGERIGRRARDERGARARGERMQDGHAAGAAGTDDLQATARAAGRLGRVTEIDAPRARRERDLAAEADVTPGEQAVRQSHALGLAHARDGKRRGRLEGSPRDGVHAAITAGVARERDRAVVTADRGGEIDAVVSRSGRQGPPVGRGDRRRLTVDVDGAPGVHRATRGDEDAVIGPVGRRPAADADRTAGGQAAIDGAERMRQAHAAFRRLTDQGDISSGGDDGFAGADRVDAPIRIRDGTGEEAIAGRGDIAARGDAVGEIDAGDLAAAFERDGAGGPQRGAIIDLDTRPGAAPEAGDRKVTPMASHRRRQVHALGAGQAGDGPPVRDGRRRVGAIKRNVAESGDGAGRRRVEAAIAARPGGRDTDGATGGRREGVPRQDRRTQIRARPPGVDGDPDVPARRPDGLVRDGHIHAHRIRPRDARRDREVVAGDQRIKHVERVTLAADRGEREGRRGRQRRVAVDLDTRGAGGITRDGHAAIETADRTSQGGAVTRDRIGERPPVGGVHRGDLSVDDDRTPGRDGLTGLEAQADSGVGRGFGLAAEADAATGSRRGRVAGQDVRIEQETPCSGLAGDADVAGLGPDGLRRGAQTDRPVAGGAGRQSVDDHVAVRRDAVEEVDGAEGADAGHGDLLGGLDRRAGVLMDGPAGITERITREGHAVGETADDAAELETAATRRLRTRPPILEGDRRALAIHHDRTPGADRRGRDLMKSVVSKTSLDRIAIEGDRAAAGRRGEGVQRGDRPAEVDAVTAADIGTRDDDVAGEGGHGGAVETHAVDGIGAPGAGDRAAGADDGDVSEGTVDRDIVTADRLDARTGADGRKTEDRDVARRGQGLARAVETDAIGPALHGRAGSRRDDAVGEGGTLQRDATVRRGHRTIHAHTDDAVRPGAVRGREGDVAEHGRTGRRHDIHGVGRRVAVSVELDLAGRGQHARGPDVDTIPAAGNRPTTVAVAGDPEATDRRTAARRDRRKQVDAGDAAAVDDDVA